MYVILYTLSYQEVSFSSFLTKFFFFFFFVIITFFFLNKHTYLHKNYTHTHAETHTLQKPPQSTTDNHKQGQCHLLRAPHIGPQGVANPSFEAV
jgi:hypothetical protein